MLFKEELGVNHIGVAKAAGITLSAYVRACLFEQAEAIAQGTQGQKYFTSLSLSSPPGPAVPVEASEKAVGKVETMLWLVDKPRSTVFHEKNGWRHAKCVWSRIDARLIRAVNLAHYNRNLG